MYFKGNLLNTIVRESVITRKISNKRNGEVKKKPHYKKIELNHLKWAFWKSDNRKVKQIFEINIFGSRETV